MTATEETCLEALRDAPADRERWAVYADLLQGRGEVRGRLTRRRRRARSTC